MQCSPHVVALAHVHLRTHTVASVASVHVHVCIQSVASAHVHVSSHFEACGA